MTIGIVDKLTLLAQRPLLETGGTGGDISPGNSAFASRLQQALETAAASDDPGGNKAQAMVQLLNLQMLQSSLSLSGDTGETVGTRSPGFSPVQALLASYQANATQPPLDPVPSASSPQALSEAQLQDLAAVVPTEMPSSHPQKNAAWLEPVIAAASKRYGVDASLIKAVIKAESDFNPRAVSHAGAQGLMQLMPNTARALGVSDSFDPEQNVMAGTRFLRDMLKRYNGDLDSALAAYNWGPGNVDRRRDALPRETRNYQARVKQLYADYSA